MSILKNVMRTTVLPIMTFLVAAAICTALDKNVIMASEISNSATLPIGVEQQTLTLITDTDAPELPVLAEARVSSGRTRTAAPSVTVPGGSTYGYDWIQSSSYSSEDKAILKAIYEGFVGYAETIYSSSGAYRTANGAYMDGRYYVGRLDLSNLNLPCGATNDDPLTQKSSGLLWLAYELFNADNPQYFMLGGRVTWWIDDDFPHNVMWVSIQYAVDYLSDGDLQAAKDVIAAKYVEYAAFAATANTAYDKTRLVYDKMLAERDYSYVDGVPDKNAYAHNILGVLDLSTRGPVVEAYAEAYAYILNRLGIPTLKLVGWVEDSVDGSGWTAWNLVKINGFWYHVGIGEIESIGMPSKTYNDEGNQKNAASYRRFMVGSGNNDFFYHLTIAMPTPSTHDVELMFDLPTNISVSDYDINGGSEFKWIGYSDSYYADPRMDYAVQYSWSSVLGYVKHDFGGFIVAPTAPNINVYASLYEWRGGPYSGRQLVQGTDYKIVVEKPYHEGQNRAYIYGIGSYRGIDFGWVNITFDDISITSQFTDPNFLAAVRAVIGKPSGEIYASDVAGIKELYVSGKNISSLAGIEYFAALEDLECQNNRLTALDLSHNAALIYLTCGNNQLTALDLSVNTKLKGLGCQSNLISELNVSGSAMLEELYCWENSLTAINVSNNPLLKKLECAQNQLAALDVSNNPLLTKLYCRNNRLSALDVSHNTELEELSAHHNNITTLGAFGVSNNTKLVKLDLGTNALTALDVSANTALTLLHCDFNNIAALDVSNNVALTSLSCHDNPLTALDVTKNTALTDLSLRNCLLTSIDVTKNTLLSHFECADNQLTTLDLSANTQLDAVWCQDNLLTELDVSSNSALDYLDIHNNYLPSRAAIIGLPVGTRVDFDSQYAGYAVAYDANGGANAPAAQTKLPGVNLTINGNSPTRGGYNFIGWAATATATTAQYQPGDVYAADASITLYAVWSEDATAAAEVTITVTAPVIGAAPVKNATVNGGYSVTSVSWTPLASKFKEGAVYTVTVTVSSNGAFGGISSGDVTINGQPATIKSKTADKLTITYTFPALAAEPEPEPETSDTIAVTITAPVIGETPNKTAVVGDGFAISSASVSWSPVASKFKEGIVYTATVTLNADASGAFADVTGDDVTINGQQATIKSQTANKLTLTYTFSALTTEPITEPEPDDGIISAAAITITAPSTGTAPVKNAEIAGNFRVTNVSWSPLATKFKAGTSYTVTITLTANEGCSFAGINAANVKVNGNAAVVKSNTGSVLTITYTFAATE